MTESPEDRREKLLAMAGFAGVALSALIVASIFAHATLVNRESAATVMKSVSESSPSPEPSAMAATDIGYNRIDACQAPLADAAPSASGLELTLDFPATARVDARWITGTATLTNTSDEPRRGGIGMTRPTIALSSNGVVRWHTPADDIVNFSYPIIDLEPRESVTTDVAFNTRVCSPVHDRAPGTEWRHLPYASPGEYQLSAFYPHYAGDGPRIHGEVPGSGPVISAPVTITLK